MKEGDVVLAAVPQADGKTKLRPVILLREMPRYYDLLVCIVSTQLHQQVPDFDEIISPKDQDFASTGLVSESLIRLAALALVLNRDVTGVIGSISSARHQRLLQRLSEYLVKSKFF